MLTYGDGVSDVDLDELLEFHRSHGKLATRDRRAPAGPLRRTSSFDGRPRDASSTRSRRSARAGSTAASSCSSRRCFDYIDGDETQFEREPLERLADDGQLDGVPARRLLAVHGHAARQEAARELWESGDAPWKVWS